MSTPETLTVEVGGRITLPPELRERYRLAEDTPVRVIETSGGILLVPLTGEPVSAPLAAELEEWQSLAAESFGLFPFEDGAD